jgi:hypothetical protein
MLALRPTTVPQSAFWIGMAEVMSRPAKNAGRTAAGKALRCGPMDVMPAILAHDPA